MRNKRLWKRGCSVLLASAMLLTSVPVSASGFETEIPAEAAEIVEGFVAEEMLQEEPENSGGGQRFLPQMGLPR